MSPASSYWQERKTFSYYKKVLEILSAQIDCESIIDIGGRDSELLKDLPFKDKTILDIDKLPLLDGVKTIKCDFYKWVPLGKYDIVINLQVLEHLEEPSKFAKKLFDISKKLVIISVPYKWPKGFCKYHLQDPVDEQKILEWTQRIPNESYIIEDNGVKRIICIYKII